MLVLDTHALLFWTLQPELLGRGAAAAVLQADRIGIPAIAFWEVALLVRKRKLALDMPVAAFAREVGAIPRVIMLPLTADIAVAADGLKMHADPADRFIVATALAEHARLVTRDTSIKRARLVPTIWS